MLRVNFMLCFNHSKNKDTLFAEASTVVATRRLQWTDDCPRWCLPTQNNSVIQRTQSHSDFTTLTLLPIFIICWDISLLFLKELENKDYKASSWKTTWIAYDFKCSSSRTWTTTGHEERCWTETRLEMKCGVRTLPPTLPILQRLGPAVLRTASSWNCFSFLRRSSAVQSQNTIPDWAHFSVIHDSIPSCSCSGIRLTWICLPFVCLMIVFWAQREWQWKAAKGTQEEVSIGLGSKPMFSNSC